MTSSQTDRTRPPRGGSAAPDTVRLDGEPCFLAPLAHEVARRHWDEFPDEAERYGPAGLEWCAHDMQWILWWAWLDAEDGLGILRRQLDWLVGLLAARDYPIERVARSLELGAEVVTEAHPRTGEPVAAALKRAAAELRRD
jgi:hypothetical protein